MDDIFDQLIKKRGITEDFLYPKYLLGLAEELPDIKKTSERIIQAVNNKETVLIYGDYDVDGVTASALMFDCLKMSGVERVEVMLPDRFIDGYGMGGRVKEKAKELGASLIVTVDCGSNNSEVIDELSAMGVDVIVTDHHEIMKEVPKSAVAVVNPKRDEKSELRELCGCGVAFLVMQKMVSLGYIEAGREKWFLDLVLVGTLCDSMTLNPINRMLSYFGMKVLKKTKRPGLIELLKVARAERISSETIGFQIGPRLNAGGRMESAETSLRLLMSKNHREAFDLAMKLNQLNQDRRNSQRQIMEEIPEVKDPVIVVTGKWHEGVLGIIAGRLVEKYHKPAFVLAETEEGVLKGSGRSFGDFNLAEALKACKEQIISGGGHAAACGLKVSKDGLDKFIEVVNNYYLGLKLQDQEKYLEAKEDLEIEELGGLNLSLMEKLRALEPFGLGNPEPIFLLKNMKVERINKMGAEGQHMRMTLKDGLGKEIKLVAFNAPEEWMEIMEGKNRNVWINLVENEWQNYRSVEGRILQIKESSVEKM